MIITENLTKKFDDLTAVQDLNLEVKKGTVLVLLGPNGAGKTTTVRMLSSILRPTSGRAWIAGCDVVNEANKVRALVGVLTEQHGLYRRMNAIDYLRFFCEIYGMDRKLYELRIRQLLEKYELGSVSRKRLGEYSKGMRQKLALVRTLIHDPPVLLLDEPTSAMDPESARMVRDSILQLRSSERTIILCTHNLAEAEELADHIAIIRQGRIVMHEAIDTIKARLFGSGEYVVHFANSLDGKSFQFPEGVNLTHRDDRSMNLRIENPDTQNPQLLRLLLASDMQVISMQMIPQSLEKAYLQAIHQAEDDRDV